MWCLYFRGVVNREGVLINGQGVFISVIWLLRDFLISVVKGEEISLLPWWGKKIPPFQMSWLKRFHWWEYLTPKHLTTAIQLLRTFLLQRSPIRTAYVVPSLKTIAQLFLPPLSMLSACLISQANGNRPHRIISDHKLGTCLCQYTWYCTCQVGCQEIGEKPTNPIQYTGHMTSL